MRIATVGSILLILAAGPSFAAGTETSSLPDMAAIKAKVEAKDYAGAIEDLNKLAKETPNADVYNMLGFSYRNIGDMNQAAANYDIALRLDPKHKGALEYQGEMFLKLNDVEHAKENLAKLAEICPSGCEEKTDLEKEIAEFKPAVN